MQRIAKSGFHKKLLTRTGGQHFTSVEQDDELIYQIKNCSACYVYPTTDPPICHMTVGALQDILQWVPGGEEHQVLESLCIAKGDPFCEFPISPVPIISSRVN